MLAALAANTLNAQTVTPNGKAVKESKTFKQTYSVAININAPAEAVWKLLTNAANFPSWNSTAKSIEGNIAEGQKIKLVANIAPDRTFKLKVKDVVPNKSMNWSDGAAPMFRGVRHFTLAPNSEGGTTFTMTETMGGLMFPMIKGSLPDFTQAFEDYAADLKKAAE